MKKSAIQAGQLVRFETVQCSTEMKDAGPAVRNFSPVLEITACLGMSITEQTISPSPRVKSDLGSNLVEYRLVGSLVVRRLE